MILSKTQGVTASFVISGSMIFAFDRFRYYLTNTSSKSAFNDMLTGSGKLSSDTEKHFQIINAFSTSEVLLHLVLLLLGVFLLRSFARINSVFIAIAVNFPAIAIGYILSARKIIDVEFVQSYIIVSLAAFVILGISTLEKEDS